MLLTAKMRPFEDKHCVDTLWSRWLLVVLDCWTVFLVVGS